DIREGDARAPGPGQCWDWFAGRVVAEEQRIRPGGGREPRGDGRRGGYCQMFHTNCLLSFHMDLLRFFNTNLLSVGFIRSAFRLDFSPVRPCGAWWSLGVSRAPSGLVGGSGG